MNSRPWLDVAVYVRAPAAEAPIATDSAANSDSTLMYSQPLSSPPLTSSPSASTMCVCGVIGYAQMTCGRASAIASATAREPSVCLSMRRLPHFHGGRVSLGGRSDVGLGDFRRELGSDRSDHRVEPYAAAYRGEAAEQRN